MTDLLLSLLLLSDSFILYLLFFDLGGATSQIGQNNRYLVPTWASAHSAKEGVRHGCGLDPRTKLNLTKYDLANQTRKKNI